MIRFALPILFEAVLRALVAACILWLGLRVLRVKNVRAQKAAWSVMLLAAIAMPLLILPPWIPAWAPNWAVVRLPAPSWSRIIPQRQSPASAAHIVVAPALVSTTAPESISVASSTNSLPHHRAGHFKTLPDLATVSTSISTAPPPIAASTTPAPQMRPFRFDPLTIAWFLYLAVCAALVLRWSIGLASSIRLWLQATPVEAAQFGEMDSAISTRSSSRIFSPVNIGSGIVLPADYSEWPPEKLRAVLAHETSHVRQRDFYLQLLAGLYAALTWFSPLGWWLKSKLSELSEAISDRAGLEESRSRSAYAQLLLEFAALPRPTLTGVPMAHKGNLSRRIDGLLNDSTFKQAFGGTRRALVAAVVVPLVLIAMAATVRVKAAASQENQVVAPAAPAQSTAQANPASPQMSEASAQQAPAAPPSPDAAPAPAAAPNPEPEPAPVPPMPPGDQTVPVPPLPPIDVQVPRVDVEGPNVDVHIAPIHIHRDFDFAFKGDRFDFGGEPIAIVGDPGTEPRFFGWWNSDRRDSTRDEEIDKVRKIAHGHFILFRRDNKTYFIDDPATVDQFEALNKQLDDLGGKMKDLGNQMRAEGRERRDDWAKVRESSENIPTPDLTKEMANLDAAVADLKAHQGGTVTREQLGEIQRAVGELQRQVMSAEFKVKVNLDMKAMNAFSDQQRALGQQMGELGGQMGRLAHDNIDKMNGLIDQGLKNGQAKPAN